MTDWTEEDRLGALQRLDVLDSPAEEAFDEIVRVAAMACRMPMAAVSLVDRNRQWFKAQVGLGVSETHRDVSFCAHAIHGEGLLIVPDATKDARFVDNGLVADDPSLRFYAGAVIRSEEGLPLGALCVLDTTPHPAGLTDEQLAVLQTLADQVSEQLRLRQLIKRYAEKAAQQEGAIDAARNREHRVLRALDTGAVGWWEWDVAADVMIGSAELARDMNVGPALAREGAPLAVFLSNVHPLDRAHLSTSIREAVEHGDPLREEFRVVQPGGLIRWVLARGRCLYDDDGKPTCFPGLVIEVTDRVEAEQKLREANLRRELAMNAAQLGSWDHDLVSKVRRFDARALEILGLTQEEGADQRNVYLVMHPDDRERIVEAVKAATSPSRIGPFRETFRVIDRQTQEVRWVNAIGRSEFKNGVCTHFIGMLDDVTEERVAEEHRRMLTDEMAHRVKNTLAIVGSIVDATLRGSESVASARNDVAQRLGALARAHDALNAKDWTGATIATIVHGSVEALGLPAGRLEIDGPPVRLSAKPALQLSLALHELGTNAIKYGALSNDTGRIAIRWTVSGDAEPVFGFEWDERGGPPVNPPSRRGFGTRLIEAVTAAEFRGESRLDYRPSGLRWTLSGPFAALIEEPA